MIKASISFKGTKEKDIPKGEVFKRHGGFGDYMCMSVSWKH